MRRLARWSCVILAIGLAGCGSSGQSTGGGPLTVANFNPFSGGDAAFGPEQIGGCIPATRLINQAGGVLGHQLTCQAVDTRGDPADAVPAASKMLATTSNLIGVLGPSADEAQATVPVINTSKIPMFADTGEAAFDHSNYAYFYRLTPADDVKGYAMAQWAYQRGYKRAATVFGSDTGAQSVVPTLVSAFQKLGGTIVSNQKLALDQSSYRTEVEQMLATHPQVIFTEADPQTDATFLSELKQLHGLIPVIGTETTLQAPWLKAVTGAIGAGGLASNVTGMQPYAPTSGPAWTAFNASLLSSSGIHKPAQWSSDPYSMTYYDAVNLIALAMLAAKSTQPAVFSKQIVALTTPLAGAVTVSTFAAGKKALAAGKKIRYVGAGGEIAFDQWRNSSGSFEAAVPHGSQTKIVGTVSATQIAKLKAGG